MISLASKHRVPLGSLSGCDHGYPRSFTSLQSWLLISMASNSHYTSHNDRNRNSYMKLGKSSKRPQNLKRLHWEQSWEPQMWGALQVANKRTTTQGTELREWAWGSCSICAPWAGKTSAFSRNRCKDFAVAFFLSKFHSKWSGDRVSVAPICNLRCPILMYFRWGGVTSGMVDKVMCGVSHMIFFSFFWYQESAHMILYACAFICF